MIDDTDTPFTQTDALSRRLRHALAFAADVGARALREFDHNFRGGHQEGVGLGRSGAGAFTAPVETKHDGSVVTRVDRESEGALRELIRSAYPGDAILGEELGAHEPDGWAAALGTSAQHEAFRWILDPIDGTRSFVHGVPFWGVMITLERVRTAEQARTPGMPARSPSRSECAAIIPAWVMRCRRAMVCAHAGGPDAGALPPGPSPSGPLPPASPDGAASRYPCAAPSR